MNSVLRSFKSRLSLYMRLQLITKLIYAAVLMPLFSLVSGALVRGSGKGVLTNQAIWRFLISPAGLVFVFATFILILIGLIFEVLVLIKASDGLPGTKALPLFGGGLARIGEFFTPAGVGIFFYLILIVPMGGMGLTLSFLKRIGIPSFVSEHIENNVWLSSVYVLIIIALIVLGLRYIFTFHFFVLEGKSLQDSLKSSRRLVETERRRVLSMLAMPVAVFLLSMAGTVILWHAFVRLFVQNVPLGGSRDWTGLVLYTMQNSVTVLAGFIWPAFQIHVLTRIFNRLMGRPEPDYVRRKMAKVWLAVLALIFVLSVGVSGFFKHALTMKNQVDIVAHRGGGNLAAENSLLGMERAKQLGAAWAEVDVQRTSDGRYILNHDSTFRRLSGDKRQSSQMTLAEIQKLAIRDLFDRSRPSQPYVSVEKALAVCGDSFGLFLELKGKTADKQMVDDLVRLIKANGQVEAVYLISLDLNLIRYLETTYPEIRSGYLFYLAVGDVSAIPADMLLMETEQATDRLVDEARAAGKNVFVWTVNEPERLDGLLKLGIDGIITDLPAPFLEKQRELLSEAGDDLMLQLFQD